MQRTGFKLFGSFMILCAVAGAAAPRPEPGRTSLDGHRFLGTPRSFRNLTLIPVYDLSAKSAKPYLTLDEGLKRNLVTVTESPQGGEVNRLFVSNAGKDSLYLMSGEIVLGGQQDRCVGSDTIVPPGETKFPITVFCVEHGRWNGRAEFEGSAVTVASAEIRASAQDGAFSAARPVARVAASPAIAQPQAANGRAPSAVANPVQSASGESENRHATVAEAQQQVWDKVARKNARFKASPSTGTYREVANLSGAEAQKAVSPYLQAFAGGLDNSPQLVGAVAGVNGKIVTADIFGDPALFRKLWPKLLRSYAQDAAESASPQETKPRSVSADDAKRFILAAARGGSRAENRAGGTANARFESKDTLLYRIVPEDKTRGAGGFGGAAGAAPAKALHENFIRK